MKYIFTWLLISLGVSGWACDNCNIYLNINPNDFYHNFGIRLRSRFHEGTFNEVGSLMLKHGGGTPQYVNSTIKENYQRIEFAGTYYWNLKWNTQVIVPFVQNTQEINDAVHYFVQGFGDVTVLQNYIVFNTKNLSDSIKFKHRFTVGAGIKMATGRTDVVRPTGVPNIDLQPGTGSWDAIGSATYIAMYQKMGLNMNANYKWNTANHDEFRYGNTLNVTMNLFRFFSLSKTKIMPSLGLYGELFDADAQNGEELIDSGGQTWMMNGGLSIFVKRINLQFNYQRTFASNLLDKQQIPAIWRYNVGLYYNFK